MTAEIAILNKQAVALAADSAVTIGGVKTFNSVNKLFELSKFEPVGIMIYGNASIMGVPWETIIKFYRDKIGRKSMAKIDEYASDFISFLKQDCPFFPPDQQSFYFESRTRNILSEIKGKVLTIVQEAINLKEHSESELLNLQISEIGSTLDQWDEIFEGYDYFEDAKEVGWKQSFIANHIDVIDRVTLGVFEEVAIEGDLKQRLSNFLATYFGKNIFIHDETGVVIAGFGTNEFFPSLRAFRVDCKVNGLLRYEKKEESDISFEVSALIMPFAQSEMVYTFCSGISPGLRSEVDHILSVLPDLLHDHLLKVLDPLMQISSDPSEWSTILEDVRKYLTSLAQNTKDGISRSSRRGHVEPLMDAVSFLPPIELAEMAESLVNLTSFKRKISAEVESVGGPIDVALITKGDGFIWVKRKHYFDANLNPNFFRRLSYQRSNHNE